MWLPMEEPCITDHCNDQTLDRHGEYIPIYMKGNSATGTDIFMSS